MPSIMLRHSHISNIDLFAPVNWLCVGAGLHFLPHLLCSHCGLSFEICSVLILVGNILQIRSISRGCEQLWGYGGGILLFFLIFFFFVI